MAKRSVPMCVLVAILTACDAGTDAVHVSTTSMTEMALPDVLRTVAAIDPSGLQLQVTVDDVPTTLVSDENNIWRGSVQVPMNQTSRVTVEWGTDYGNSGYLKLAEQRRFVFVGDTERSIVFNNDYDVNFDTDRDTRNNLSEIEQNRSPVSLHDVYISETGTSAEGISYPQSGICGQKIPVGVLTVGEDTDHEAWWCATLHSTLIDLDGNEQDIDNLRLTVRVEDQVLFNDGSVFSESQSYHDDSIEIYIDGDNNKRGEYDGINDFQFRFAPIGDGIFDTARGPDAYSPPNLNGSFEYLNSGYILTATIRLEKWAFATDYPSAST